MSNNNISKKSLLITNAKVITAAMANLIYQIKKSVTPGLLLLFYL